MNILWYLLVYVLVNYYISILIQILYLRFDDLKGKGGYPTAFFISNRSDAQVMTFLDSSTLNIKEQILIRTFQLREYV